MPSPARNKVGVGLKAGVSLVAELLLEAVDALLGEVGWARVGNAKAKESSSANRSGAKRRELFIVVCMVG